MYVYMYMYMYMYVYVCVYVYIYIYILIAEIKRGHTYGEVVSRYIINNFLVTIAYI